MSCGDRKRRTTAIAKEHKLADERCGRSWVCACGHCRRARRTHAEIDAGFTKIRLLEEEIERVRALKEELSQ